jgi:hypothetical protein
VSYSGKKETKKSLVLELHHHATKKEEENRIDGREMREGGIYIPLVANTCTI